MPQLGPPPPHSPPLGRRAGAHLPGRDGAGDARRCGDGSGFAHQDGHGGCGTSWVEARGWGYSPLSGQSRLTQCTVTVGTVTVGTVTVGTVTVATRLREVDERNEHRRCQFLRIGRGKGPHLVSSPPSSLFCTPLLPGHAPPPLMSLLSCCCPSHAVMLPLSCCPAGCRPGTEAASVQGLHFGDLHGQGAHYPLHLPHCLTPPCCPFCLVLPRQPFRLMHSISPLPTAPALPAVPSA